MGRVSAAALAVWAIAVVAACQPISPAPPSYMPPVIDSVTVSPSPAHPGGGVSLTLAVSDDQAISAFRLDDLYAPSGARVTGSYSCHDVITPGADAQHAVITLTCTVPNYASNGTWHANVRIWDNPGDSYGYEGLRSALAFDVAGGTDDNSGPGLLGYELDPPVVHQNTPFKVTMHLVDESQPVSAYDPDYSAIFLKLFAQQSSIECRDPVYTATAPTLTDLTWSCTPNPSTEFGVHMASVRLRDALGQTSMAQMFLEVV